MRKQRTSRKSRKSMSRPTKARAVLCSASAASGGLLGSTGESDSYSSGGTSLILHTPRPQNLHTVWTLGSKGSSARLDRKGENFCELYSLTQVGALRFSVGPQGGQNDKSAYFRPSTSGFLSIRRGTREVNMTWQGTES